MVDITKLKFARTTWANIQLAKLCPGNDISKLQTLVETNDFEAKMEAIFSIILIMKQSYDRKAKYDDENFKGEPLTRSDLEVMDDDELMTLLNLAFESFANDGKTTIETKAKKGAKKKVAE